MIVDASLCAAVAASGALRCLYGHKINVILVSSLRTDSCRQDLFAILVEVILEHPRRRISGAPPHGSSTDTARANSIAPEVTNLANVGRVEKLR